MPADVAPLVADGGNIRLVRRVAAYAYGSREVTWPEGAEDPQGELPDGREFGWAAQLAGPRPGLSGRRFVRADAVIDAVEGVSNTEQLLDDAAERTGGDVHFETLISGRGLAGQVPGVDFALGDRVPARFWGRVLPGQLVTEVGWEEDGPYVKLGGQMLRDLDALARARAELTRTIRKEREETAGAVESVRSYADSAVSRERTERVADVAQVREVLGGARADETVLVSQLAAVQAQITGMVGAGETPPPPGLLNSYLWMNTRLWEQQREVNRLNDAFRDEVIERRAKQQALDDKQTEMLRRLEEVQQEAARRRPRPIFARFIEYKDGYTDPEGFMKVTPYAVGDRGFLVDCLGSWTGEIIVRATAFGPLSANSIDSYRVPITTNRRTFHGTPEAAQMSYIALDMTVFPD